VVSDISENSSDSRWRIKIYQLFRFPDVIKKFFDAILPCCLPQRRHVLHTIAVSLLLVKYSGITERRRGPNPLAGGRSSMGVRLMTGVTGHKNVETHETTMNRLNATGSYDNNFFLGGVNGP